MTKPDITPEAVEREAKGLDTLAQRLCGSEDWSTAGDILRAQAERIVELELEGATLRPENRALRTAFTTARNDALREAADVCDFVDQDDSLILPHSAYVLALIEGDTNDPAV